jgi:glycosyltransferase involved in cell wall biosynthesis
VWLRARKVGRADVYLAATTPPLLIARLVSTIARRRRARFVYHKQDIYPEVVTAPGIMRDGRRARLLRALDARTERRSDVVVVLSDDMARTVEGRGTDAGAIEVINNFDPWELDTDDENDTAQSRQRRAPGPLRLVFAGNLGRFQNLPTLMAALTDLGPDADVEMDFFGKGPLADELRADAAAARLDAVRFHGFRPPEEVARFVREQADLAVVSLEPGVVYAAYPSKTMTYLRQGCPVLALVEADSALARDLVDAGAGVQADPADPHAVADVLRKLAGDPDHLAAMRAPAAELYRRAFAPERQLARWRALFARLATTEAR